MMVIMAKRQHSRYVAIIIVVIAFLGFIAWSHRPPIQFQTGTETSLQNAPVTWKKYYDDEFGISFDHPSSWDAFVNVIPEEDFREIMVSPKDKNEYDVFISVEKWEQEKEITPQQWFVLNRSRYSELMQEISKATIDGYSAMIMAQPKTCNTAALMVAVVDQGNSILVISDYELTASTRSYSPEFIHLLETLSFDSAPEGSQTNIPTTFEFPEAPENISCP
jgi:hypothetical protein